MIWYLKTIEVTFFLHSCVDTSWEVFIGCVLFRVPPDLPMLYIFVFYRDNSLNFNSETIKSLCKTPSAHVNNVIHGALWALVLVTFKIIVRKLMPRKKIKKQLIFSCVCRWIIRGKSLKHMKEKSMKTRKWMATTCNNVIWNNCEIPFWELYILYVTGQIFVFDWLHVCVNLLNCFCILTTKNSIKVAPRQIINKKEQICR